MLAILIPKGDDKLYASLVFQKCKDFKVYAPEDDAYAKEYLEQLPLAYGGLAKVEEPFVCILEPGALPDKNFVGRILRTINRHPEFDVYHVNLTIGKDFPRKLRQTKFFKLAVLEGVKAPLSTFIFRTVTIWQKAVYRSDESLDTLATVLACSQEHPIRNVWRQRLEWVAPELPMDAESVEKRIRERLDFYRWSETAFSEDYYPLGVSERLELICKELVRLYPVHDAAELKEILATFQAAQGTFRKMRASSALKAALKQRELELSRA